MEYSNDDIKTLLIENEQLKTDKRELVAMVDLMRGAIHDHINDHNLPNCSYCLGITARAHALIAKHKE